MTPVQDIPSNGNDLVDSLDRLKVDDGEPRLGRVATMEKINHNGLAVGKTMGYNVRRGSFFTSNSKSHKFALQHTELGSALGPASPLSPHVDVWSAHVWAGKDVFSFSSNNTMGKKIPSLRSAAQQRIKIGGGTDMPAYAHHNPWRQRLDRYVSSLHLAAQQRVKLTDNTEIPQPVLTTILGDDGFTGMFAALKTFAGLFANPSEVTGTEVTDKDFWNDIHIWTANIFSRRVLADKTCRALREMCIPLLFRKVRIYRAEYRAIQPLKAMLLNDRIQGSMITYGVRARTSTLSHRAVAMKRSWGRGDDEY